MVRIAVAFASLLASTTVLVAPVFAAPDPQPATQAQQVQPAPPVKEKRICRADPSATGSIMPQRVCHTRAEWDAISQAGQAAAEQMLQRQDLTTGR